MNDIFNQYVALYDLNDDMIIRKKEHSHRVKEKANWLARALELDEENIYLATIIGQLHDIGRFEQATQYHSFNDSITVDHGDLGCKILFEDGMIKKFPIEEKYYSIIEKAIRNHNKLKIEDGLNEQELLHAKIIRDADKLDIFYILACLNQIDYPVIDDQISETVKLKFKNHQLVSWKDIKNSNDDAIKAICFVFDFEFKESYLYLKEQRYLEHFEQKLNHFELFGPYIEEAKRYVEERI